MVVWGNKENKIVKTQNMKEQTQDYANNKFKGVSFLLFSGFSV